MCGFTGLIAKGNTVLTASTIEKFEKCSDLISHRGPDAKGSYVDNKVVMFHYRLSIIDLDARSNQPYIFKDQNLITVFNGEIYNYKEIREDLGLVCETTSDTEVLTKSFSKLGKAAIPNWNGIFAACFYDKQNDTITLTRDRYGVKPLYTFESDEYFAFTSEAKVLYEWLTELEIDFQGLNEYLYHGTTISENTLIKGVKKFASARMLTYNIVSGNKSWYTYWENPGTVEVNYSTRDLEAKTRELLNDAVSRQLVADVPVAVFLSGGIDSSAITAFASRNYERKLSTYSVEFDFNIKGKSELDKAKIIAKKFNTDHHELKVESENITEIFEALVYQQDDPFADAANIPLYLLTRQIKDKIKVVLQGDGGDELFAGYRRYDLLGREKYWYYTTALAQYVMPNSINRKRAKRINKALGRKEDYMKMGCLTTSAAHDISFYKPLNSHLVNKLNTFHPFEQYKLLEEKYKQEPLVQRMLYTDLEIELQHTYLAKVDKSTMLNGVEARVPFLDNELSSFIMSLPAHYKMNGSQKKFLLRQALRGIIPDEILDAPKRGFDVPYGTWLRKTMRSYMIGKFTGELGKKLYNQEYIQKLIHEHQERKADHSHILWKLLVLTVWLERYQHKMEVDKIIA